MRADEGTQRSRERNMKHVDRRLYNLGSVGIPLLDQNSSVRVHQHTLTPMVC